MFLERDVSHHKNGGTIEVIAGSMFSGKTEELIRRLRRMDTRYSEAEVVSHDENSISSSPVENSANILLLAGNVDVVAIDEAQFFDKGLVEVCQKLADMGIRVIVAGLDMDFQGKPFGPMPDLMAIANYVSKVHAICVGCGSVAQFSHRLVSNDKQVLLGEQAEYEPLCRICYNKVKNQ